MCKWDVKIVWFVFENLSSFHKVFVTTPSVIMQSSLPGHLDFHLIGSENSIISAIVIAACMKCKGHCSIGCLSSDKDFNLLFNERHPPEAAKLGLHGNGSILCQKPVKRQWISMFVDMVLFFVYHLHSGSQ